MELLTLYIAATLMQLDRLVSFVMNWLLGLIARRE